MQRRQQPVFLLMKDDLILYFFTLLSHHPFIDTFYYSNKVTNPYPVPHGQKNIRVNNALTRLNIEEFHQRNGTAGRRWTEDTLESARREIFRRYEAPNHGLLSEECCQLMDRILLDIDAIRDAQAGEQAAEEVAAQAR
jgi:hypothetical protein